MRHGYKLRAGTLYPMLHGMEKAGYLNQDAILRWVQAASL